MARILVIDDDAGVRAVVHRALERLGHTVVEAADGGEGLAIQRSTPADLVVTDIYMPGRDGIETIRALREETPGVRILAISGGARRTPTDSALMDAELLGADASLAKPFSVKELHAAVASLLGEAG